MKPPSYRLEPLDPDRTELGYHAVMTTPRIITAEDFGRLLITKPRQPLKEMAAHLYYAQLAAFASLIWEGWDVEATSISLLALYPDRAAGFSGGGTGTSPKASQKQIVKRMLDQGVPYSEQEIDLFLDVQLLLVLQLLREGYDVETTTFGMKQTVSGLFNNPKDPFDPERHTYDVITYQTHAMVDWHVNLDMYREHGQLTPPSPKIYNYKVTEESTTEMFQNDTYDLETDYRETSEIEAQSGNVVHLFGRWLAYNRYDKRQGLFYISPSGKTFRRDEASFSGVNYLLIPIPWADNSMRPGTYQVELRTIIRDRDGLQTVRFPYPALVK